MAFGKAPHLFSGKEPVGADADKAQPGLDSPEGLLGRSVAAQRIPGIHGAQDGQVGVGVEALDEPLALIIEITGDVEAPAGQSAAFAVRCPGIFPVRLGLRPKRSSNSGADL